MEPDALAATVAAARSGDVDAFTTLVDEYRTMAGATAFAWVRNRETAREVCQEAFTDAWRLLGQLEDPNAFSGWFRRIVVKHCDRRTRGRTIPTSALDGVDPPSGDVDPSALAVRTDEQERLRLAIEALPRDERTVIALRYLAERSEADVASWLELPVGTVKTRLRRARARLREEMHAMANETLRRLRPEIVADDLTSRGVLPVPTRSTPLIRAVERNDQAMVETLLALGADPNQRCGCVTVEPPLWTAVLTGRHAIARALLAAGADADVNAPSGQSAVQIAMRRSDVEMVQLLLETSRGRLETGIKAVDLFAPLSVGDRVLIVSAPGVGTTVLLGELSYRFLARGLRVSWTGFLPPPLDEHDIEGALAELGLTDRVDRAFSGEAVAPGVSFVFTRPGHDSDADRLVRQLAEHGNTATFVVHPFNEPPPEPPTLHAPFDARIAFDSRLAERGILPAIDGSRSTSRARVADEAHDRMARAAVEALIDLDAPAGAAVAAYLAQPFFTAEPFRGQQGEYVSRARTLAAVCERLSVSG